MGAFASLCFSRPEWASRRVALTISCRDTDEIPKVDGAGEVFEVDGRRMQRMHNGLLIFEGCYYGGWTTEIIRGLNGHHEPQEEVSFAEMLKMVATSEEGRSPLIVELGSFWAYYSMWFLKVFPEGEALCLEPDPRYLEVGKKNFELNDLTGAFILGGIGDGTTPDFAFAPESDLFAVDAPLGESACPQYSLGQLADKAGRKTIDVLVVDIQGAEVPLLMSNFEFMREGHVRYAVISTHHESISGSAVTHQEVVRLVTEAGGTVLCEHSVSESFSGDGLVCVSFRAGDPSWDIPVSRARAKDSLFGEPEISAEFHRLRAEEALREHGLARDAHREQEDELKRSALERRLLGAQIELQTARLAAARAGLESLQSDVEEARAQAQHQLAQAQHQLAQAQRYLGESVAAQGLAHDRLEQLEAVMGSRSWRMTRPMRRIFGQG